jgi:hypothetical protein
MLRVLYPIARRYCYPKSIGRDELLLIRRANVPPESLFSFEPNPNMSDRRPLFQSAFIEKFLAPNLQSEGRAARKVTALGFLVAAVVSVSFSRRLSLLLLVAALFTFFEAMRGWCVLRACGIKTKV